MCIGGGSILKKKWGRCTFVNNYDGKKRNCQEGVNENLSDGKGGVKLELRLFWALAISVRLHFADLFSAVRLDGSETVCTEETLRQILLKEKPSWKKPVPTHWRALKKCGEVCKGWYLNSNVGFPEQVVPIQIFLSPAAFSSWPQLKAHQSPSGRQHLAQTLFDTCCVSEVKYLHIDFFNFKGLWWYFHGFWNWNQPFLPRVFQL